MICVDILVPLHFCFIKHLVIPLQKMDQAGISLHLIERTNEQYNINEWDCT